MRIEQSFVDAVAHKTKNIIGLLNVKAATGEAKGNQCVFLESKLRGAMRCVDVSPMQPEACIEAYAYLSIAHYQASLIGDRELFSQVGSLQRYVGSYIQKQLRA